MIEKGAKVDALDNSNQTPLHCAAQYNENADNVKILIEKGANLLIKNSSNQVPYDLAYTD